MHLQRPLKQDGKIKINYSKPVEMIKDWKKVFNRETRDALPIEERLRFEEIFKNVITIEFE